MRNILKHIKEHSEIHHYAWVLEKNGDTFYTDSEQIYSRYTENGYKCVAEFYKGEQIVQ